MLKYTLLNPEEDFIQGNTMQYQMFAYSSTHNKTLTISSSIRINNTIVHFSDIRFRRIIGIPVYTRYTPSMWNLNTFVLVNEVIICMHVPAKILRQIIVV